MFPSIFSVDGEKALKSKPAGWKPRHAKRSNGSAGAWNRGDRDSVRHTQCHHILAGI